jgi:hypothetical protein
MRRLTMVKVSPCRQTANDFLRRRFTISCGSTKRCIVSVNALAVGTLLASFASPVHAQESAAMLADQEQSVVSVESLGEGPADQRDRTRQAMLDWTDTLLDNVLYRPEDVESLREQIASMSPPSLESWMRQTTTLRGLFASEAWQATNDFLRRYLRLQAVYTEEEIDAYRARTAQLSPRELTAVVWNLIDDYYSLLLTRQALAEQQQALMRMRRDYLAQLRDLRIEMRQIYQNRDYFADAGGAVAVRQSSYFPPAPLITSRDAALGAVWRGIFPWGF